MVKVNRFMPKIDSIGIKNKGSSIRMTNMTSAKKSVFRNRFFLGNSHDMVIVNAQKRKIRDKSSRKNTV